MYLFKNDKTPYPAVCFGAVKDRFYKEQLPITLYWGINLKYTRAELKKLLSAIKLQTTKLINKTDKTLYTNNIESYTFVFEGTYPTFANLLIEASLIRLLADKEEESYDGYPYQIYLRGKIFYDKVKLLSDIYEANHGAIIQTAGHSPFTGIDLKKAHYKLNDYIKCSTQTPMSYGNNCRNTYEILRKTHPCEK